VKRALAALVAAAVLPAFGVRPNWNDLLPKGITAAECELKAQQPKPPAASQPKDQAAASQSGKQSAALQAQDKPQAASETAAAPAPASGELLPLRRVPLIAGAMGVNLLVEVDGTVKSWGAPEGEGTYLGDGTEGSRKEPEAIPRVSDIVDAAVAAGHALLLSRDGTILTWGRNQGCELTVTDDKKRLTPFPVIGVRNAVQVAAGHMFSAAVLRDGTVMVWGTNEGGLLANGKSGWREPCAITPVPVEGLSGVKKLVVGSSVIVLKQDGTVWGWGSNRNGELCDGTTEKRNRPVQMKGIANAVDIDLDTNSMIVLADGTVWTCGSNAKAELARQPEKESIKYSTPVRIAGISTAVAVRSPMVRLKDGTLLGWGSGIFGTLGNGRVEGDFPKPSAPIGLGPVLTLYWASNSAYAIKADGTVMAWGFYIGGPKEWQLTPVAWRKVKLAD
jgi:alpha-tubulin suppressor-like RCC1 family protein